MEVIKALSTPLSRLFRPNRPSYPFRCLSLPTTEFSCIRDRQQPGFSHSLLEGTEEQLNGRRRAVPTRPAKQAPFRLFRILYGLAKRRLIAMFRQMFASLTLGAALCGVVLVSTLGAAESANKTGSTVAELNPFT